MCGICGKYSPAGVATAEIQQMLQAIIHRGPDDEGLYLNGPIGLGNRRLSIIDLPGGHQPISNEDGNVQVVYNGEIYNYRPLRNKLIAQGHRFKTESDTEVIVHLYEEYGEACVTFLNGMFTFALWDDSTQTLILARDRLGQKPLFYADNGPEFLFASEIKAIRAVQTASPRLDVTAMHHYLSLRFVPPPQTMLQDIQKLPPAHILVYQAGQIRISRYWDINFGPKVTYAEGELVEALDARLKHSVKSHTISDVPVGAFLSGGMDSSMIVALMAQNQGSNFKTFAIGVKEQDFNELPYAKIVAEHYQTDHVEQYVQANLIQMLPKIIWHLDEPSDPIAACQFYAAELAARHVKVVLGGDGGDELFAGFDRYMGLGYIDYYRLLPALMRNKLIGPLLKQMPDSFAYKNLTQKLRWIQHLSAYHDLGERYAEATCFFRFSHQAKQNLFSAELWQTIKDLNATQAIIEPFNQTQSDDIIDKMLYADFRTRLPEHSLMLTDRLTMAHSLEARSPFLDHELVEFVATIPSDFKNSGQRIKVYFALLGHRLFAAKYY